MLKRESLAVRIGIILALFGVIVAIVQLLLSQQSSGSQDSVQSTQIALLNEQLFVQQEMATLQAGGTSGSSSTATAVAERFVELQSTAAALATEQSKLGVGILLNEDFEDGKADKFKFTSGQWQVIDDGTGNKVLEANSSINPLEGQRADLGIGTFEDGSIEYRVRLVEYDVLTKTYSGMVWLGFRETLQGTYVFDFVPHANILELSYADASSNEGWKSIDGANGVKTFVFLTNVWYSVRVDVHGAEINAYLDGN